jgi:hypothetical protein
MRTMSILVVLLGLRRRSAAEAIQILAMVGNGSLRRDLVPTICGRRLP